MTTRVMTPFTRAQQELRQALETMRDLYRLEGYAYRGPQDFVLQHGVWYAPRRLPRRYRRGLPKHCFANALIAAAQDHLRYIEGYGWWRGVLFHHAWAATADHQLLEVTWPELGQAYLGVEFSRERADNASWHGDTNVLDDWKRRWPLLREPWTGENPLAVWEPSPWLDFVKAGRLDEARAWMMEYRDD